MKTRSSDFSHARTMLTRRTCLGLATTAMVLTLPLPALASPLDAARANGTVGEGKDGFAVARDSSVVGLVDSTNQQRRAFYRKKADEQGVPIAEVQAIYAQAIREKAESGWWIETESGWQQK